MRVWDPLIRLLHWTLVIAIATAWLSTLHLGFGWTHEPAGYVALGVITVRLIWGFLGGRHARFTQFVRGPSHVLRYARLMRHRQEPRHIGHNPLGGWMAIALLMGVASVGITGWLQTTDRYWGSEILENVHHQLAWALVALIAMHVIGVIATSLRHRENLVRSMFTGRKDAAQQDDVV